MDGKPERNSSGRRARIVNFFKKVVDKRVFFEYKDKLLRVTLRLLCFHSQTAEVGFLCLFESLTEAIPKSASGGNFIIG